MSESSSDNSHLSGSDLESPQKKPLGSIRRRFLKNKKQPESEETASPTVDEHSNTVLQQETRKSTIEENDDEEYVKTVPKKKIKKMFSLLAIVLLLLLLLTIILFKPNGSTGGSSQEATADLSSMGYCSNNRLESVLKKLEDQMEAFEEAAKMLETKLAFLDEKIDSHNSLVEFKLNILDLKVSGVTTETNPDFEQVVDVACKRVVAEELEKHEADGIGEKDHALASGGAFILRHSEAMFPMNEHKHHDRVSSESINMVTPSFGEPGRCFSLKGSSGFVEIRLRTEIVPESVTLEHVSSRVAYNMSSAPKDCVVSAWFVPNNISSSSVHHEVHKLVRFRYDVEKNRTRQTFEVEKIWNGSEDHSHRVVNVVRLDVLSNYGADHTCIYRLRVHGHEVKVVNGSMPKPTEDQIRSNSATSKSLTKFMLLLPLVIFFGIAI